MKKLTWLMCVLLALSPAVLLSGVEGNIAPPKTALLIIDVQMFYFPDGALPLDNPEAAALNIQKIIKKFRSQSQVVIHVRHNASKGAEIHPKVTPLPHEKVISKDHANSFRDTELLSTLESQGIKKLVICGMQTHMCVEAATRAASDLGFQCQVIHDACTTRALTFLGHRVSAKDVHYSTLSSLAGTYATITDTASFLKKSN